MKCECFIALGPISRWGQLVERRFGISCLCAPYIAEYRKVQKHMLNIKTKSRLLLLGSLQFRLYGVAAQLWSTISPTAGISAMHTLKCCHLKGVTVSLGGLPSSKLFGSAFCSLTPATSCGSVDNEASCVLCMCGVRERPQHCAYMSWLCVAPVLDLTLVMRNLMCQWCKDLYSWLWRKGGNGESHTWSGLILIHPHFQERLKEEVFQSNA